MPLFFNKETIPWSRWVSEFVVVVLGVFFALAVENYREYRNERAREQSYLVNLLQDLESDQIQLEQSLTRSQKALGQIESLLLTAGVDINSYVLVTSIVEHGYDRSQLSDKSSLFRLGNQDYISWASGAFDLFIPNESTYTSLLSTGDLRTIRDEALRRKITFHYESVRNRNSDQEVFLYNAQRLDDFLIQRDIDVFDESQLAAIPDLAGVVPVLSLARDSQHWQYARKVLMQQSHQDLLSEVQKWVQIGD